MIPSIEVTVIYFVVWPLASDVKPREGAGPLAEQTPKGDVCLPNRIGPCARPSVNVVIYNFANAATGCFDLEPELACFLVVGNYFDKLCMCDHA
jgi:hypothetical protein